MRIPSPPAGLRPWLPLFAAAVVVSLLLGVAVDRILDPSVATSTGPVEPSGSGSVAPDGHIHGGTGDSGQSVPDVAGLSLSQSGYTLVPERTEYEPGTRSFSFSIVDTNGRPVTGFTPVHEKPMHLFVVRRDLTGYQHLHPDFDTGTGTWHTNVDLDETGPWRAIADFAVDTGGEPAPVTLGTDLTVPGDYHPVTPPEPGTRVTVDGFDVALDFQPKTAVTEPALLTITRDGEPAELERYLGANGHLVMLRADDLGFAHVHPDTEPVGDAIRFWATVPSPGDYRLYLDFQVDGTVHTAQFTVTL